MSDEVAIHCPESLSNQISKKYRLEMNAVRNGVKQQGWEGLTEGGALRSL
jgi:hypothetical protein